MHCVCLPASQMVDVVEETKVATEDEALKQTAGSGPGAGAGSATGGVMRRWACPADMCAGGWGGVVNTSSN